MFVCVIIIELNLSVDYDVLLLALNELACNLLYM